MRGQGDEERVLCVVMYGAGLVNEVNSADCVDVMFISVGVGVGVHACVHVCV